MTLGGLALAVGILVDDATVEIENIHRKHGHAQGNGSCGARWRAADRRTGVCIYPWPSGVVFVPVLLLTGAARFLFTSSGLAVVFAMLASYLLSRTVVPTVGTTCCVRRLCRISAASTAKPVREAPPRMGCFIAST